MFMLVLLDQKSKKSKRILDFTNSLFVRSGRPFLVIFRANLLAATRLSRNVAIYYSYCPMASQHKRSVSSYY